MLLRLGQLGRPGRSILKPGPLGWVSSRAFWSARADIDRSLVGGIARPYAEGFDPLRDVEVSAGHDLVEAPAAPKAKRGLSAEKVPNSSFDGASVGDLADSGSLPTGWSHSFTEGLDMTSVEVTEVTGEFIEMDFNINNTTGSNRFPAFRPYSPTAVPAKNGQRLKRTLSIRNETAYPGSSYIYTSVQMRDAMFAFINNVETQTPPENVGTQYNEDLELALAEATVVFVDYILGWVIPAGTQGTHTMRFYEPFSLRRVLPTPEWSDDLLTVLLRWKAIPQTSTDRWLLALSDAVGFYRFEPYLHESGNFYIWRDDGTTAGNIFDLGSGVDDGGTHALAISIDRPSQTVRLSLDGGSVAGVAGVTIPLDIVSQLAIHTNLNGAFQSGGGHVETSLMAGTSTDAQLQAMST